MFHELLNEGALSRSLPTGMQMARLFGRFDFISGGGSIQTVGELKCTATSGNCMEGMAKYGDHVKVWGLKPALPPLILLPM